MIRLDNINNMIRTYLAMYDQTQDEKYLDYIKNSKILFAEIEKELFTELRDKIDNLYIVRELS